MTLFYLSNLILRDMLKQDDQVSQQASNFLVPQAFAIPGMFSSVLFSQFLQIFDCKKPLVASPFIAAIGVGLAAYLSLGAGKGLDGIIIPYDVIPYIIAIMYIAALMRIKDMSFFKNLFMSFKGNKELLVRYARSAGIMVSNIVVEVGIAFILPVLAGIYSVSAQETLGITAPLTLTCNIIAVFFPLAGTILMGKFMGAGRNSLVRQTAMATILVSASVGSIVPSIFAAYPEILQRLANNNDKQMTHTLKTVVPLVGFNGFLEVMRESIAIPSRRLGDGKKSTLISVSALLFGLFISCMLALYFDQGTTGIILGSTIGLLSAVVILGCRYPSVLNARFPSSQAEEREEDTPPPSCLTRVTRSISSFFYSSNPSPRINDMDLAVNTAGAVV